MAVLVYIDTSLLVKRYLPEPGSVELETRLVAEQPQLRVSELVRAELMSALRRKERQGHLDAQYRLGAHAHFLEDVQSGAVGLLSLDPACLQRSVALLRELSTPLATLDSLHLATAIEHGISNFFTCDAQLSRAAIEAGMKVWPEFPNAH